MHIYTDTLRDALVTAKSHFEKRNMRKENEKYVQRVIFIRRSIIMNKMQSIRCHMCSSLLMWSTQLRTMFFSLSISARISLLIYMSVCSFSRGMKKKSKTYTYKCISESALRFAGKKRYIYLGHVYIYWARVCVISLICRKKPKKNKKKKKNRSERVASIVCLILCGGHFF